MALPRVLKVGVAHCDLRQANYPVAVGHYRGDVIVHAEARLDALLDGVLRRRFDLGIYPGEIGTSEIVRRGAHPPGAIVVGLGPVGDLTPERLRSVFASALRRYALAIDEDRAEAGEIAFSSILIGTDGGALAGVTDSIHAIVHAAVDVNRALSDARLADRIWIDRIEFIELYEDVAIRAARAVQDLPSVLGAEFGSEVKFDCARQLDTRPGGRFLRPSDPYASGWWQRIAIRKKTSNGTAAAVPSDAATALQFTVLSDRARLEQDVAMGQRTLIEQLMTSATSHADYNEELSATLYQVLVPAPIKDRIRRGGDLLLMVDRAGAAYPYELMADGTPEGIVPLAGRPGDPRGILRQFETDQYRQQPEMARAERIFILGDPKTILLPPLPGARQEAEDVAEIAAKHGLEVVPAPREYAEGAIVKLMTKECRILHFAAHGAFDPDPMKSGVVISDRLRITPAEVESLPSVPELVFLNCCYLGKMGEARSAGPDPRLAASLAEGFIRVGVRAVIAAGWAVDDLAGPTFARTFYERFLSGDTFGTAVRQARDATRRAHEKSNTWGAYQCYGNPDYRFRRVADVPASPSKRSFLARSEALQALWTLASTARSMQIDEAPKLTAEFDRLYAELSGSPDDQSKPDWAADGETLSACGEVCGELEAFDRAIEFYRKALATVPASAPFRAAEQLANLLSRLPAPDAPEKAEASGQFVDALAWLDWLDGRLPPTKERWALRGALYKRWAIRDPARRRAHLRKAETAYSAGAKLSAKANYQTLNALALKFVLGLAVVRKSLRPIVDGYLAEARSAFDKVNRDFWDVVGIPDALLHKHLVYGTLPGGVDEIIAGYRQARAAGPSLREWASVRDHVVFLATMTADPKLRCHDPKATGALQRIQASLGETMATGQEARVVEAS
jgi:CHAT domain-containing protein